jgi:hypothetical protein
MIRARCVSTVLTVIPNSVAISLFPFSAREQPDNLGFTRRGVDRGLLRPVQFCAELQEAFQDNVGYLGS